jgi:NADPH2:quinone reductase
MKALVFNHLGTPSDVIELADIPVPTVGDNELLVKMHASSIGPGDSLFTQGRYPEPKRPVFPHQVAGLHGVGVITRAGKNTSIATGTLVAFSYSSVWAEYICLPEDAVIKLPNDYPIEKAAQIVNLITAWDLLKKSEVSKDDWLVLTAAGSAVATMILQFAVQQGINVISIVREPELYQKDLERLGAKLVLTSTNEEDIEIQINKITQSTGVKGVIDCVGGRLLSKVIKSINYRAHIIIYGAYSQDRFELHSYDLLLKGASISAYNYRFLSRGPKEEEKEELTDLFNAAGQSEFEAPIAKSFPLDEHKAAFVAALSKNSRDIRGKYIFRQKD